MSVPDLSMFRPTISYVGDDDEETQLGHTLVDECREYLDDFAWCDEVIQSHLSLLIPPVLGVVLFQIVPLGGADPWIWVIGGDLPFAYMEFDAEFTPDVDAAPTVDNARMLSRRLDFLEAEVIGRSPG